MKKFHISSSQIEISMIFFIPRKFFCILDQLGLHIGSIYASVATKSTLSAVACSHLITSTVHQPSLTSSRYDQPTERFSNLPLAAHHSASFPYRAICYLLPYCYPWALWQQNSPQYETYGEYRVEAIYTYRYQTETANPNKGRNGGAGAVVSAGTCRDVANYL